ncbi:hypothetical protein TNCT_616951 [Trichonephila clavata]|uniref:Uncharacterized protein n=1 Tax=Trichonephila clavata TaxID=2740835 RepID=A0A8X6HBY5_TRICU|nr:hypothetical protein TNCT_616951 [Trichonephila clavata]
MKDKMPVKMYDNAKKCFLWEFRLFFNLLRVFGIEIPRHSSQTKQKIEDKKEKLISCFSAYLRYILIVVFCLATVNSILWLIILPRGSKEIANTFLTLSVELFYVLIFRRRQEMRRITERLRKILNTMSHRITLAWRERNGYTPVISFLFKFYSSFGA